MAKQRPPEPSTDPDARIAALHERVRQREEAVLSAQAAAEREKQRTAEQRRNCIAHAEMLAERAKGLDGIEVAQDTVTVVYDTSADNRPVLVGVRVNYQGVPKGKPLLVFVVAYTPGSGDEEPSYWLPPPNTVVSDRIVEHSRRCTFAEALDLMIAAVEEAFERGGTEELPF